MDSYKAFLESKVHSSLDHGFEPISVPDKMFGFQKHLLGWATRKGRCAIFADCGLGKTLIQLAWADNVAKHTGGRVLILTPLAVSFQTVREAQKFGIDASICRDGNLTGTSSIVVTNYERLHYFKREDFQGAVCDESSILKNFDGSTKDVITDFMKKLPYRFLCTATPSPNDYIELGTSSEALGEIGFMDMLNRFFKKSEKTYSRSHELRHGLYRFRGHAENQFWKWVCSWAKAVRRPSDIGFEDNGFILPTLTTENHVIKARKLRDGFLFDMPAIGLTEQREERRRTIVERCEKAAEIVLQDRTGSTVSWCHLNDEGDMLEKLIPNSVQIAGSDSEEKKEVLFRAFADGEIKALVTKPKIAGFGVNWQNCAHQTFFPSHSFEQWYQAIRRSWRFGQKNAVKIDVISTDGEKNVLNNMLRKEKAASDMMDNIVLMMNCSIKIQAKPYGNTREEVPSWL